MSSGSKPVVWHSGEKEMQRLFSRSERMDEVGAKILRDHMLDQHH